MWGNKPGDLCARVIDAPAIFSFSSLQDRRAASARRERDREIERERGRKRKRERGSRARRDTTSPELGERQHHCIRVGVFSDILTERLPPPWPDTSYSPQPRSFSLRFAELPRTLSLSLSLALLLRSLLPRRSPFFLYPSRSLARLLTRTLVLFLSPSLSPVKRPVQLWRGYT